MSKPRTVQLCTQRTGIACNFQPAVRQVYSQSGNAGQSEGYGTYPGSGNAGQSEG